MELSRVLAVKILVTTFMWCLPLLTFSPGMFSLFGLPAPEPIVFARLLGAAYAALIVAYGQGFVATRRGEHPIAVVWVGIISNGLASLILANHGIIGSWSSWSARGQAFMWLSLLATSGLTISLAIFGLRARARDEADS